ncbi:non-ribosomal peptide synthetase [Chitinophaga qingshengii]|uniref:Amino acid adenylation domain-containing protein n=1 Tax=Chitinophaga qingshengii TaxID=1569794 RepID=A0ABR7TFL2_9BACT|nr:non-ribosomal peptide synthetase [Chitinophaga qingshengii]MBC9929146.1 amino acid adenylation domain-containing protein [Chitinophaga qingshengii]
MPGFNLVDIIDLLEKANDNGVNVSFDNDKLIVKTDKKKTVNNSLLAELKANKDNLVEYFQKYTQHKTTTARRKKITARDSQAVTTIPLSFNQERLWFIDQLEGSVQYHLPAVLRLKGRLNRPALAEALQLVVNRHEILRTVILQNDGVAYQQVQPKDRWELIQEDVQHLRDHHAALQEHIKSLTDIPFDLSADHMLRAHLLTLSEEEYVLVVTMHHIASDGWSLGILVQELAAFYRAVTEGRAADLAPLPVQYADFALWQRDYLSGEVLDRKLDYWKKQLGGVATLQLPADFKRPAIQSIRGAVLEFNLDGKLAAALKALAQQQDATLFMTLLAAFKVLLYRYSGQHDICVGSPVAGRTQHEINGLVGFFINTLALRSDLSADPSFLQLLQQVKETTLSAYEHQDVPFEKIVEAVVKTRDMSSTPVFQVMFSLQNIPDAGSLELNDIELIPEEIKHDTAKLDLTLNLRESADGLTGVIEYGVDVFSAATISRMVANYQQLLEAIVQTPSQPVSRLSVVSREEQRQLEVFNANVTGYPNKTVLALLEEQVKKTPAAVAVSYEGVHLTYQELDNRSNQVAHYLKDNGNKHGDAIGLLSYRGLDMIVAIWGILKSGGTYVPIHIDYPAERVKAILEDAGIQQVLYTDSSLFNALELPAAIGLPITNAWSFPADGLMVDVNPGNAVYIMYTSGSTGKPKGIAVNHRNIVKLVYEPGAIAILPEDKVLQWSNYAFDGATYDIYGTLLKGASLFMIPDAAASDVYELAAIMEREQITFCFMTTALFNNFTDSRLEGLQSLRRLLFGGELVSVPHVSRALSQLGPDVMVHMYGPTETVVYATSYPIRDAAGKRTIPIGTPLANTQLLVLDQQGQPVPIGVSGELHIGGAGVAIGYVNNDALTAEKFITLDKYPGRWYKTGDLVHWQANGTIVYVGRMDDQVKVRGYRIEPGEIENVLKDCAWVSQAVVIAKKEQNSHHNKLIGYIVPEGVFEREKIVAYLRERLPDYMVPSLLMELKELPLNVNGKVDKKALPAPDDTAVVRRRHVAPSNETERTLADIWQDLLGIQQVGIYDNFFELGGDSIVSIQVVARIRRSGYVLQPRDLFTHQTIERLAAVLQGRKESAATGEQGILSGESGLLPVQQWYFDLVEDNTSAHFNQSVLLGIDKKVDAAVLDTAIRKLVQYHDALRFTYTHTDTGWKQEYGSASGALQVVDLQQVATSITAVCESFQKKPDVLAGRMICPVLILTPGSVSGNRLLLTIHHLVVDGVSWRILLEDLQLLLNNDPAKKAEEVLGPKTSSYRQWYGALTAYARRRSLLGQEAYWRQVTADHLPLKTDRPHTGKTTVADVQLYSAALETTLTRQLLQDSAASYHTEINDLLLAALALTLSEWNGHNKVRIGLEGHGREAIAKEVDTSRTVGWFTNMYPVLLELPDTTDYGRRIISVKEQLRKVADKGLGYGVLKYISKADFLQQQQPWDVVFNYLGQLDNTVSREGLFTGAPESTGIPMGAEFPVHDKIVVNSMAEGGQLVFNWAFSRQHFDESTIEKLAQSCLSHLEQLIRHCVARPAAVYTPADYGLSAEVSYEALERFLEAPYNGAPRKAQLSNLCRLSGLQEGMLFLGLYNEQAGTYVEQMNCELENLQSEAFKQAWQQLLGRHSILRSAFHADEFNIPVQCIYKEALLPVTELDYRGMSSIEQEQAFREYEQEDLRRGFDFTAAPLMRIALIRLSEEHYRLLWTVHHILLDGWSQPVLIGELLETYEALLAGKTLPEAAEDRYEDYIRYLEQQDKEAAATYWQRYLQDMEEGCLLPFVSATAARTKGVGAYREEKIILDESITQKINTWTQQQHITPNTLMQGIWSFLLSTYTGRKDIAFGVTVSGRPEDLPGVEQRVGLYINTLPLHAKVATDREPGDWLRQLQTTQLQSREFQYTGLNEILQSTPAGGDLFDTSITFQNFPVGEVVASREWQLKVTAVEVHPHTNYPLTIIIGIGRETSLLFSYNSDLLDPFYAAQIATHFKQVLLQLIDQQVTKLQDINLLTPAEHALLLPFNQVPYPHDKTFPVLFAAQALRTPDAVAVVFEDTQFTYRELDERATQLGHYLRLLGVKSGSLVPLYIERSALMVVGILGILKAGAAYVPIDPDFPADRVAFILADTAAAVVVSSAAGKGRLPGGRLIIALDEDMPVICSMDIMAPLPAPAPQDPVYVIYTSGSTGNPKGVLVTHRNLLDYIFGLQSALPIADSRSFALLSSIATDLGNTVLFPSLLSGGPLHVFSKDMISDGESLNRYFSSHPIDCIKIVASHWKALSAGGTLLLPEKLLIFGGEALETAIIHNIRASGWEGMIVNHYGPTETTIGKLLHVVDDIVSYGHYIPVGKPFSNTRVYVLNESGKLSPVGVAGELYIGGDGVAAGYLNNEALTVSRFVEDPFTGDGSILYRTGDVVRVLPDGNILFAGRADDQVKIRGYRVELGEVERGLLQQEGVQQAVVVARGDDSGNRRLVGYVIISPEQTDITALTAGLKKVLPDYMVPSALVVMDKFPLLANGKVDRKSLPDPEREVQEGITAAPVTQTEQALAAIWSALLEVESVGVHDDFFALGGHSLLAIRVVSAVRKQLNVEIKIGDVFDYPTIEALAAKITGSGVKNTAPQLVAATRPAHIPLSYSQERLWFIDQLEGSTHYHTPHILRLSGTLDHVALSKALQLVVNRHEILRTVMVQEDGNVWQRIMEKDQWQLNILTDLPFALDTPAFHTYVKSLIDLPFDLQRDHMLRAHLLVFSDTEQVLVLTLHHIASDGWSTGILVSELEEGYAAFSTGRPVQLPALPIQYADYAIWQRSHLTPEVLGAKTDYWKTQLSNVEALQLPTDYSRPAVQSIRGRTRHFELDKALSDRLQQLSQQEGATLFMTCLSVFNILMYRYTGADDICVGTPIAGRTQQETEGLIGFFINTLALRADLSDNPSFVSLLQQVKQTTLSAYEHQEVPFEKIVELVVKDRDMSRHPLFQVMFVLQNMPEADSLEMGTVQMSALGTEEVAAKFDLTVYLQEGPQGLNGFVVFCADLFTDETIDRMMRHFKQLLEAATTNPAAAIRDLPLLSVEEQAQLQHAFNDTAKPYPQDKTIPALFSEQAKLTPTAPALVFGEQTLTYQELEQRANRLANYLRRKGVREEEMVPVCLDRSPELIVAILGILKAGAAYVPVDADYPEERIALMLADTHAAIAISDTAAGAVLRSTKPDLEIIHMDEAATILYDESTAAPDINIQYNSLAYVIYTSGSTGRPKGVMVTHQNVVSLVKGTDYISLTPADIMLSTGSPSFDASTLEYWGMLLNGGLLVLCPLHTLLDHTLLKAEISNRKVTKMWFTASWLNQLTDTDITVFEGLDTILAGGEKLSEQHIERIHKTYPDLTIINGYGPTENTTFSLTYQVDDQSLKHTIPIGRPLSNRQAYILDEQRHLCPIGVPGEIYVGGAGLSRGYLDRPELTTERFVEHSFDNRTTTRLYRTGDVGRWLPDGSIVYMGRTDDQVKIRGYRIEPGEIENVLLTSEQVKQAVVIAAKDEQGAFSSLIAYIVPAGVFEKEAINAYLHERLPEYMVPSVLVELEQLPLTTNGKVDKRALPAYDTALLNADTYVAPRNSMEQHLAAIWEQLLGVERVGIHDNFFELGGHSLLAVRLMSAIKKEMQAAIQIGDVFDSPTLRQLARKIQDSVVSTIPVIVPRTDNTHIPLSFSQERFWFIDQFEGSTHYHVPLVLQLKSAPDTAALTFAFQTLINRHEVLRTVIIQEEGVAYQHIGDKDRWELQLMDGAQYDNDRDALEGLVQSLISKPFNLSADHMLRAHLIALNEEEHLLVVVWHHIVSDGWSVSIIIRELGELYDSYIRQRAYDLPDMPVQYADFAIWQRKYLSGEVLQRKTEYWKNKLTGVESLQLPLDFARPPVQSLRGATSRFLIPPDLTARLHALSRQEGVTLFMTLLAAYNVLLHRYSGQDDICVGSPIAGRTQQETEGLIGIFINTLALRSDLGNNPSFLTFLQQVRETTLGAYEHQEVPFEKVVEEVVKERDLSRHPLFQVMFILQNTPEVQSFNLGEVPMEQQGVARVTAQFDLMVSLEEGEEGLMGTVLYCADLFVPETIRQLTTHFVQLLGAIVAAPETPIGKLSMLTAAEREELLYTYNDTAVAFDPIPSLPAFFTRRAALCPDAIAVMAGEETVIYRELDQRSDQLAHYLHSKGVTTGSRVPVSVERSPNMVVAVLGILKAGGTYVPIDATFPEARLRYILEDTGASVVVTTRTGAERMSFYTAADFVEIDTHWPQIVQGSQGKAPLITAPSPLMYIIYTSGTTGNPKGVEMLAGAVINLLQWQQTQFDTSEPKRILQFASLNFDVSFQEIFSAICFGNTICLINEDIRRDADALLRLIDRQQIHYLFLPYVVLKNLAEYAQIASLYPASLKAIYTAGEQLRLDADIRTLLRNTGAVLYNHYGPTEVHVGTSYLVEDRDFDTRFLPPVGKPICNASIYILDTNGELCGKGVQGEICIGGAQVAKGFLNKPELTAQKFLPDPFSKVPGGRYYRTGDIGRWLPDGNIEYLGRLDDQVKIRGYRIELGEVESILQQCPLVQKSVVLAKSDSNGMKRLVGYVVPETTFDRDEIMAFLKGRLPEYMVPSILIEMESMPLTINGKVNKRALPDPAADELLGGKYAAPRNEMEQALVNIWQELLAVQRVGIYDDFFELGGHSLLVVRVVWTIRKVLQVEITNREIFAYPTVAALAAVLEERRKWQRSTGSGAASDAKASQHIVLMNKGPQEYPVFLFPGAIGLCDAYEQLAAALNDTCAVYGLYMQGIFEGETPLDNFADIAAQNITWMKQVQPEGPYRFMGHSFGGYIVHEMARQLEAQGEQVTLAAILDTTAEVRRQVHQQELIGGEVFESLVWIFEQYNIISVPHPEWVAQLGKALETVDPKEVIPFVLEFIKDKMSNDYIEFVLRLTDVHRYNLSMDYTVTEKVHTPLTVVKAAANQWSGADEHLGWSAYGTQVTGTTVPGHHGSMIEGENVLVLAAYLKEKLS